MAIKRPRVGKPRTPPAAASTKKTRPVVGKATATTKVRRPPRDDDESGTGIASGASGFARAKEQTQRRQEEYERKKERPFAFRITQTDISSGKNEVKLLYLDREPTFVRLHTVKVGANRYDDEVCLADRGVNCPLCAKTGQEGSWTLMLTALDKRPYRDKNGTLIKVSKKLVPVKGKNVAKFERQYKKHGTLRGLVATHVRSGAKEASIGEDIEFQDKLIPERELLKYKELANPANYAKAFVPLSYEEMAAKYANYTNDDRGYGGSRGQGRTGGADEDGEVSW